jgi:hypothetical protein
VGRPRSRGQHQFSEHQNGLVAPNPSTEKEFARMQKEIMRYEQNI